MAVKTPGEIEATGGEPTVPQVVPKSGITTASPRDEPRARETRTPTTDRPLTQRELAVDRARADEERERSFERGGRVPLAKVNRDALQILIEGFVSGEIDGDVLRETASATGRAGTQTITLAPGRQVQENRFQSLLNDLADVGTPQAKKRERSTVIRIFKAIADGFNGRNAAVIRERLRQESILRPAVAAGLKKRLPEQEYIDFLKEARWYDVLRGEISKDEFRQTFEKNENRPMGARDEGAIEILSAAIPVGPVLRAAFKTVRLGIRTTGSPVRFSAQSFRRFMADETGQISFKPGRVFTDGSITEQQASKAIRGLLQAIRRAEAEGKATDRLYDALRRFRNGSIPIKAPPKPTPPPTAPVGPPQAAPRPPVRVMERPTPVKPPAVLHAERILKRVGVRTEIESAAEISARVRAKAAAAKPSPIKPKSAAQAAKEARAKRLDPKSQAEFQRLAEAKRLRAIERQAKAKAKAEAQAQAKAEARVKAEPKPLGAARPATQTATATATQTATQQATRTRVQDVTATGPQPAPAPGTRVADPSGEPTRPKVLTPLLRETTPGRPPGESPRKRGKRFIRRDEADIKDDVSFNLPTGTFAKKVIYRQGRFWVTLTLDGSDPIFTRKRPAKARKGKTPKKTFAVVEKSTRRPTQKMFDQGVTRVTVTGRGIRFRGI